MKKRVFISYRRDDTASSAGRLYDRIRSLLPKQDVFFDVHTIAGGEEFEQKILIAIRQCDIALVFIGDNWIGRLPTTGKVRIWDVDDLVRIEVRNILASPVFCLPVLVSGARMPAREDLPEDIRAITGRNALPLRHESFETDTETIIKTGLGLSPSRIDEGRGRVATNIRLGLIGSLVSSVALTTFAMAYKLSTGAPIDVLLGDGLTDLLLVVAPVVGFLTGFYQRRRERR